MTAASKAVELGKRVLTGGAAGTAGLVGKANVPVATTRGSMTYNGTVDEDPFNELKKYDDAALLQSLSTLDPMDFADTDTVVDYDGEEVTYGIVGEHEIRLSSVEPFCESEIVTCDPPRDLSSVDTCPCCG